jgi:hypothetical protein
MEVTDASSRIRPDPDRAADVNARRDRCGVYPDEVRERGAIAVITAPKPTAVTRGGIKAWMSR